MLPNALEKERERDREGHIMLLKIMVNSYEERDRKTQRDGQVQGDTQSGNRQVYREKDRPREKEIGTEEEKDRRSRGR